MRVLEVTLVLADLGGGMEDVALGAAQAGVFGKPFYPDSAAIRRPDRLRVLGVRLETTK